MHRIYWIGSLVVIVLGVAAVVARTTADPVSAESNAAPRVPVIVELFTSEGCLSCPPADAVLTKLATTQPVPGADIIVLGEHIDYWDRLGWRDPFSSAAFTARQSDYAAKVFHTMNIYTPQIVVDGREQLVGSNYGAATKAIARAAHAKDRRVRITMDVDHNSSAHTVSVATQVEAPSNTGAGPAEVLLAVAEDGLVTHVRGGENGGRQLHHSAVVRSITSAGVIPDHTAQSWSATTTLKLAPTADVTGTRIVAFVRDQTTRRVLGAASAGFETKFGS